MFFTVLGWVAMFFAGFLLGLLLILLVKLKKTKKAIFNGLQHRKRFFNGEMAKIDELVMVKRRAFKRKNRFHVFKKVLGLKVKTKGYFAMYGEIIREIAIMQNPESNAPFLEFTIKQAFDFISDVTVDLESVLNSLEMPMLKSVDLSTIYGFVDLKNKINELKVVKTAKTITKPISPILKILRVLNPVKWLTTLITAIFTASLTRDLIFAFADIVAWEFSQFYGECRDENVSLSA